MTNISSSNNLENFLAPKLRFPGFDQAWEQCKLSDLGEIITGSTPSTKHSEYYSEDGILWVTPTDITKNIISDTSRKLSSIGARVGRVVPAETILVTCIASIGKNAMLTKTGSFNQQINALVPDKKKYDPYFLLTESFHWSAKMKREAASGIMQIVNKNEFSAIKTYIPELSEQRRIGEFFANLDNRIRTQQQLIKSLKKYKRGLSNDIFNQRIAFCGGKDDWSISPFGEVATINPKTELLPDEFIYLDLECVNSGKVCTVNTIKRENAPSRAQRLLEKNDVLYQMVRPYQRNNYYYADTFSYPVVASTGYAQIKCGACDPLFVYEQISSEQFTKEAMLRSTGTSYPAINAHDLSEIPFVLPSLQTQKKIGASLFLINQKIFKSEEELHLLESIKSSLLQQLFI